MTTLKERLFEVAEDLGEHDPNNRYFESLLHLSSGRITQIFESGTTTKLGAKSLSALAALGYNPNWINSGSPHKKRLGTEATLSVVHKHRRKLAKRMCALSDTINDNGLMYLIGKAEELAKTHPYEVKKANAA